MEKFTSPENNFENTLGRLMMQNASLKNEGRGKGYEHLPSVGELFDPAELLVRSSEIKNTEKNHE